MSDRITSSAWLFFSAVDGLACIIAAAAAAAGEPVSLAMAPACDEGTTSRAGVTVATDADDVVSAVAGDGDGDVVGAASTSAATSDGLTDDDDDGDDADRSVVSNEDAGAGAVHDCGA